MFWQPDKSTLATIRIHDAASGVEIEGRTLWTQADALAQRLVLPTKGVVAVLADISAASLVAYLAVLRSGHACWMIDHRTNVDLIRQLFAVYQPEWVITRTGALLQPHDYRPMDAQETGLQLWQRRSATVASVFESTALLLSTSGTTGSPKLVRLSYNNLQANALAIRDYLGLSASERPVTSLPFSYSYGLSVVNSHLLAGASIICTQDAITQAGFWDSFTHYHCTSFAGVPVQYQVLQRLRFERMKLPGLRTMTQAGGRLAPEIIAWFAEETVRRGVRFFVMYGQTEATARIAYLPPERLRDKHSSVGIAIPGGRLSIEQGGAKADAGATGEVVYAGPNVMLGYAECREDLAHGDELRGVLHTGDLGHLDAEGFLYITGRQKRFLKVFGLRMNLDEVEKHLESKLGRPVACVGRDDLVRAVVEKAEERELAYCREVLQATYGLLPVAVQAVRCDALPLTAFGKKDYEKLKEQWRADGGP